MDYKKIPEIKKKLEAHKDLYGGFDDYESLRETVTNVFDTLENSAEGVTRSLEREVLSAARSRVLDCVNDMEASAKESYEQSRKSYLEFIKKDSPKMASKLIKIIDQINDIYTLFSELGQSIIDSGLEDYFDKENIPEADIPVTLRDISDVTLRDDISEIRSWGIVNQGLYEKILNLFQEGVRCSTTEVLEKLDVPRTTVTEALCNLYGLNFLSRSPNPKSCGFLYEHNPTGARINIRDAERKTKDIMGEFWDKESREFTPEKLEEIASEFGIDIERMNRLARSMRLKINRNRGGRESRTPELEHKIPEQPSTNKPTTETPAEIYTDSKDDLGEPDTSGLVDEIRDLSDKDNSVADAENLSWKQASGGRLRFTNGVEVLERALKTVETNVRMIGDYVIDKEWIKINVPKGSPNGELDIESDIELVKETITNYLLSRGIEVKDEGKNILTCGDGENE